MKPLDLSAVSFGTVLGTVTTDAGIESAIASAVGAVAVYLVNALFKWAAKKLTK